MTAAGLAGAMQWAGTQLVVPLAANISVYHTQVFVRNPNSSAITINVRYYQSTSGTPPAGLRACSQLVLQANQTAAFDVGAQCGLNGIDDDFGMLILEDAAQTNSFFAYSRTQTPTGIGFSVEGFPTANFSGAAADALGLQKLAAAPNYRSNCFVSTLSSPVNWQLQLIQGGSETVLGSLSGSLPAFQTTRILDVFAAAGLSGDFSNVRARFSTPDAGQPPFVSFCTLETSSNGSADFRIAKTPNTTPLLSLTWNGAIGTVVGNVSTYVFTGPTVTVDLTAVANVAAYGSAQLGKSGLGASVSVSVCYQDQAGPGLITPMGSPVLVSVLATATPFGASGSVTLPAGTHLVGFCELNVTVGALNNNGTTAGVVIVTQ